MNYVAQRFIDEFVPGDIVPAARYQPDHIAQMVERGVLTVEVAPVVVPVEPLVTAVPPGDEPRRKRKRTTDKNGL